MIQKFTSDELLLLHDPSLILVFILTPAESDYFLRVLDILFRIRLAREPAPQMGYKVLLLLKIQVWHITFGLRSMSRDSLSQI